MFPRIVLAVLVFLVISLQGITPALATGLAGGPRPVNENPPAQPIPPLEGEKRPFIYDAATTAQLIYWRQVMINIVDKINQKSPNNASIDSVERIWQITKDNKMTFTASEAKMLCLMVSQESELPPKDLIPSWPNPTWPQCGNVLETMFGAGIYKYLSQNGSDEWRLDVYRGLISRMGLEMAVVENTINKNIEREAVGQPVDLEGNPFFVHGEECYNADNNIPKVQVTACGVLCTVSTIMISLLNAASEAIVKATVQNPTFTSAVTAAMVLYITIYGAMVALGLTNINLGDALMRIVKLGVVTILLTSDGVMLFFNMIRCFFIEGMTYLVNAIMMISLEAVTTLGAPVNTVITDIISAPDAANICSATLADATNQKGGPLVVLETLFGQIFSPHMFLTIMTLFISGVQGIIIAIFLIYGLIMLIAALIMTAITYLSALIALYLLLSMIPIFIAFILFEKTREITKGYISHITTNSFTVIVLFGYCGFFIVVIEAAVAPLLDTEICYRKLRVIAWVFDIIGPTFISQMDRQVLDTPPFGFFEVIIFIILVLIFKEFESSAKPMAENIAGEVSSISGAADKFRNMLENTKAFVRGAAMKGTGDLVKAGASGITKAIAGARTNSANNVPATGGGTNPSGGYAPPHYPRPINPGQSYTTPGGTKVTDKRGTNPYNNPLPAGTTAAGVILPGTSNAVNPSSIPRPPSGSTPPAPPRPSGGPSGSNPPTTPSGFVLSTNVGEAKAAAAQQSPRPTTLPSATERSTPDLDKMKENFSKVNWDDFNKKPDE